MSLIDIYESNFKNGNYNLGSMFMDCMLRKPKEQICQIDAAIEASETCGSVFSRSVRLARCLSRLGLRPGDVLALGGRNHLDLQIPCYAAMLNGLPVVGVDPYFKYAEIKVLLKLTEPKIAFCQQETQADYARAAEELGIELTIVTFDGECTLNQFMDTYGEDNQAIEEFQPAVFDTEKVYAWLVSTSGTSGLPKIVALKHTDLIKQILVYTRMVHKSKKHGEVALNLSPVQWISSYFNSIGMLLSDNCRVQTSTPDSIEHIIDIINKYRPISLFTGPSLVTAILKHDKECDMSCFDVITLTGAKIFKDMMIEFKSRLRPDTVVYETYGQTETIGPALLPNPKGPIGSCGICIPGVKVKLVDPNSGNEITEPNVPGELWYKGPLFSEYYNDPEETAKAFSEDGFFKTGDLLYRDEQQNYYFIDRLKMLIKYRNYQILPPELEEVIFSHPGVLDVGVVGIPHAEDGQHPVACVVRRLSCDVTAQEIKDLVIAKLSASKQLRGGVVFLDELPKTSTGKVARAKLMEIVMNILNDKK